MTVVLFIVGGLIITGFGYTLIFRDASQFPSSLNPVEWWRSRAWPLPIRFWPRQLDSPVRVGFGLIFLLWGLLILAGGIREAFR